MDYGRLNGSALNEFTASFINQCCIVQCRLYRNSKEMDICKNWTSPGRFCEENKPRTGFRTADITWVGKAVQENTLNDFTCALNEVGSKITGPGVIQLVERGLKTKHRTRPCDLLLRLFLTLRVVSLKIILSGMYVGGIQGRR